MMAPELSIVLPTYNRAGELHLAVESALEQTAAADRYELLIVDNASKDGTPAVLEELTRQYPGRIRALRESRQGVSYARQAGIDAAHGDIIAFFDDDVRVSRKWVATILESFAAHPELECVGGRVLPMWSAPPPSWLTPEHWAPLGLQDFGDTPFISS